MVKNISAFQENDYIQSTGLHVLQLKWLQLYLDKTPQYFDKIL